MALFDPREFLDPQFEFLGSAQPEPPPRRTDGSVDLGTLVPRRPLGSITPGTTATGSIRVGPSTTDTRTTRQTFEPAGPLPTLELPTFEAPEFDERGIAAEAQRLQGPSVRELRRQLRTALQDRADSPVVQRMNIREALQGFGAGLGRIQVGARREARSAIEARFARETQVRQIQHQTETAQAQANFQAALDNYFRTGAQVRTTGTEGVTTEGTDAAAAAAEAQREAARTLQQINRRLVR